MKQLTKEEFALLQQGMREELLFDVRQNAGMKYETNQNFDRYLKLLNRRARALTPEAAAKYDDDIELMYEVLQEHLSFWNIYFIYGSQAAFDYQREREEKMKQRSEEILKKYYLKQMSNLGNMMEAAAV